MCEGPQQSNFDDVKNLQLSISRFALYFAAPQNTKRKSARTRKNPRKKSAITGDSDDDGEENDYDYDDSFIDDDFEESDVSSYDDAEDDSDYTPGAMEEIEEELNELKG